MDTIRVILADDHEGVRAGLISMLSKDGNGIEVVGEATNGLEAIQLSQHLSPHVVLLDLRMPDMDGTEVAREILSSKSTVQVIAISAFFGFNDRKSISELLESGIAGCITKDEALEQLVPAIQTIVRGERWLSPMVQNYLSDSSLGETGPAF